MESTCYYANLKKQLFHFGITLKFEKNSIHRKFCPTSGGGVTLKTGRRELPGSNPGCACRPSRSEFIVVFSKTRLNTAQDPLERFRRRALHLQAQVFSVTISLNSSNQPTNYEKHIYNRRREVVSYIFFYPYPPSLSCFLLQ